MTSPSQVAPRSGHRVELRTGGAAVQDRLVLDFPPRWRVEVISPRDVRSLNWPEIAAGLEHPYGQPAIRDLARVALRPLVVVEDPLRPAPIACLMPVVLDQFRQAGIPASALRILIGRAREGTLTPALIQRAVGQEAASSCQIVIHDPADSGVLVGHTSRGTRIEVNREMLLSDFVVGVGGALPGQMAGFAGGLSLALGVLSARSVRLLPQTPDGSPWKRTNLHSEFRRETDEIARMIGLKTAVSVMINTNRDVVRVLSGEPALYDSDVARFTEENYRVPSPPESVGCVVANAYPDDVPPLGTRTNALSLLLSCRPQASRVLVTSRVPILSGNTGEAQAANARPNWIRTALERFQARRSGPGRRIRAYQPGDSWPKMMDAVTLETMQAGHGNQAPEVWVYPFASLQILQSEAA